MRLVILARSLEYGGAERQLVALARGLHRRGHRVVVAVFYRGGPLERDLHEAGVPTVAFDKSGRWDVGGFLVRLATFLRRERPDVLHGYLSMPDLVGLALRPVFRGKVVWGLRGSDQGQQDFDRFERAVERAERVLSRFADLVIANSHAGKAYAVAHGFPAARVVVVQNGIDTERFRPDPDAGLRLRAELGLPAEVPLVGLVGRLDPQKDHPTFLRAATVVAANHHEARFVCVGTGPTAEADRLHALAAELGLGERVVWAGARRDMPAVYNALDLLVLSSAYGEGFPNVVGEAMACGVPCAVTDVGDAAFVVGDLGAVVPPRDAAALAGVIAAALAAGAAEAVDVSALRGRIVEAFSLPQLVDQTEALLARLVAEGRQR